MKRQLKSSMRGVTLIELLLALGLISIVIMVSTNILMVSMNSQRAAVKEYSLQSDLRRVAEHTNEVIRYSKAVFAVPSTFVSSESKMDLGWNYLMVSSDGKRIVSMEYDSSINKHAEKVLVPETEGLRYRVSFEKDNVRNSDKVLSFRIYASTVDENGNMLKEKIVYESSVETVNAIQVVDKGTLAAPSIALAYRGDGQTSGKGKNQIAYITIVIDVSNSMNLTPSDGGRTNHETNNSRITKVREALIGDGTEIGNGVIQSLSKEENIFVSLVPFANSANFPSPHANSDPSAVHPIYEVYQNPQTNQLLTSIKDMKADGHDSSRYGGGQGGTNTGDGLRRAYYLHDTFRDRMNESGLTILETDQVHHYMIVLVDGETTFETALYNYHDNGFYTYSDRRVRIGNSWYYRFNWNTEWRNTFKSAYLLDGNIPLSTTIADNPLTLVDFGNYNISYRAQDWRGWYETSYTGYVAKYGEPNTSFDTAVITGNGSSTINNSAYIAAIGNKIDSFENGTGINSYLIGYASGLTTNITYIGNSIGNSEENRYNYDDPDFNLEDVFKNIATDIMADFWIAAGPQIRN